MEAQHIKGPWRIVGGNKNREFNDYAIRASNGKTIARVMRDRIVDGPLTRARLIAAAPTMYSYVKERAKLGDAGAQSILGSIHA